MAFSVITVPGITDAAYTPDAADGANGNKYQNDGALRILIHNPNTESLTLTIVTPETRDGNAVADRAIAFSDEWYIVHVLPKETYNVGSGDDQGAVTMTWTGTVTNVKMFVL